MLENSLRSSQGIESPSKTSSTTTQQEYEVPRLNLKSVKEHAAARGELSTGDIALEVADYITQGRQNINVGIIAIGANSQFHRGLVASIAHESLKAGDRSCGICAVSVRNGCHELKDQDGLFIMNARDHGDQKYEVIGSIVEPLSLKDDRAAVMARFADPAVRCVTTVVTPAGYDLSEKGELKVSPALARDIENPTEPETTIGMIVEGLRMRKEALCDSRPGSATRDPASARIAVIPCDNFPPITHPESGKKHGLGDLLRQALIDYCSMTDQSELAQWIGQYVGVPNTQVDRICPQPDPKHGAVIQELFGLNDTMTVPTEPFSSLVIEPRDPHRPSVPYFDPVHTPRWLKQPNVHLSQDAVAWCEMKTYTLNLAHMMVAWFGKYLGHDNAAVHEVMELPGVKTFLADTFEHSIAPLLEIPRAIQNKKGGYAGGYCAEILHRLMNHSLPDDISRLDTRGTDKVRERLMPLVLTNQEIANATKLIDSLTVPEATREVARFALFAAVWARCVTSGADENGAPVRLHKDPHIDHWRSGEFGELNSLSEIKAFEAMEIIFNVGPEQIPYFMQYFENAILRLGREPGGLSAILQRTAAGEDLHTILSENRPHNPGSGHNTH